MRIILEIFDLGKDKDKNEERKNNFIKLLGQYHEAYVKHRGSLGGEYETAITHSDVNKKKLHNQIMEIIRNMSLSTGLSRDQQELTEYLVHNRGEVEKMITTYFLGHDASNPREYSDYQMAHKGESLFRSVPGKEDD